MVQFLVRYAEIGLKSEPVRKRWERSLRSNIEQAFIREEAECRIHSDRGHIYVEAMDAIVGKEILSRTFGVASFSPVEEMVTDLDSICKYLIDWSMKNIDDGQSFAIRSRRTGDHCFTSQDLAVKAGNAIRLANEKRGIGVDLDGPDVEVFIEVRSSKTYIYSERFRGPGGLPLGTQGKVVGLVKDLDDALACWLLMRRGCTLLVLPVGKDGGSGEKATDSLRPWIPTGDLFLGPSIDTIDADTIQGSIKYGWRKKAYALVLGQTKGPFTKFDLPIFYPLIGLSPDLKDQFMKMMLA